MDGLNSAQRLAAFLPNQSQRLGARGYSALETVSGTFTELQQQRLRSVERRQIVITNLDGLSKAWGQLLCNS